MKIAPLNSIAQTKYPNLCIPNNLEGIHRMVSSNADILAICTKLDRQSSACKFFGVTSYEGIQSRFVNQGLLSKLKCFGEGIIANLTGKRHCNIDNINELHQVKNALWQNNNILKLWDKGAARWTFKSKIFGENALGGYNLHTIGLVVDKKTKSLYILDSLPEFIQEISDYHTRIKDDVKIFSCDNTPYKFENIIFSTKPQQYVGEYTCNNWTFANIAALRAALDKGAKITTSGDLDKFLPNNINEILEEQRRYVLDKAPAALLTYIN